MKAHKTLKKRKKASFMVLVDFWAIVIFAAAIIIFLIYINFTKDKEEEIIQNNIVGINFPHYILNIMQSEKIVLQDNHSNCFITKEMTRVEALQYLNYAYSIKETYDLDPRTSGFNAIFNRIKMFKDDKKYAACENAVINSLKSLDLEQYGVTDFEFLISTIDSFDFQSGSTTLVITSSGIRTIDTDLFNKNRFVMEIAGKNGPIYFIVGYEYNKKKDKTLNGENN